MTKVKESKELKPKKVKGRITTLYTRFYRDCLIYIRMIDGEIFEYIVPIKGLIYSSYLIIKPSKGKKKLTKAEIDQSGALIFTGAVTTVDTILGKMTKHDRKKENKLVN